MAHLVPESLSMESRCGRKIQFVFFDAGGGHRAAATALQIVIQHQARPWDVELTNLQELLDQLDILKKYTGLRIQDLYNKMLRNGWTLGSPELMRLLQLVIRIYHGATVRTLEAHWRKTQPNMVVSFVPHFNRALCESLAKIVPTCPFVTVLTDLADYPPHFWIERQPQYVVCGTDRAVEQAQSMGYAGYRIFRVSGMIIHPRFYEPPAEDPVIERERIGLLSDIPTGLVLFGGHGSRTMLQIADRIEQSNLNVQMMYICGKNEKLATALRTGNSRLPRHVEGFTSRVNYFMRLADFFIGKPGPGSVSEATAMQLPVIVECNAWTLPQERYNAEWIIENEVGIVLKNFRRVDDAVAKLIIPSTLARYQRNAAFLMNRSVFEIPDVLEQIFAGSRA